MSVLLEDIDDCVFSGFILRARPKTEKLFPGFCSYCISSKEVRDQIVANCTYTTRALTNGRVLSAIEIPLPSLDEQIAITDSLNSMEDEISTLSSELRKIRQIREGAMNDLLTGRIRLNM